MQNHSECHNSSDLLYQQYTTLKGMIEQRNLSSLIEYSKKEEILPQVADMLLQFAINDYDYKDNFTYHIIHFLLERRADPNILMHLTFSQNQSEHKHQMTLLMYSLFMNNADLFHLTLQFTQSVNIKNSKDMNAILYYIIYNKNDSIEILQQLIRLGSDINSFAKIELRPDVYEWHSVFTLACLFNRKKTIRILLEHGVDINYASTPSNNTGLHIALIEGHYDIAEMLIKVQGIKLNMANCNELRPYDVAKEIGKEDLAVLILQYENCANNSINNSNHAYQSYVNEIRETFNSFQYPTDNKRVHNEIDVNHNGHGDCIQIPFEFNQNISYPSNLSSFIKTPHMPTICIDLSSNTQDYEARIKELSNEIAKKAKLIKQHEEIIQENSKRATELVEVIKSKDTEIAMKKKLEEDSKKEILELKRQNDHLSYQYECKNSLEHKGLARKKQIIRKFHSIPYNDTMILKYLQKDLIDYHNQIKEIITEKKLVVDEIVHTIQLIVNDLNPDYEVRLYGSYSTGLSLPWSDLDVVLSSKSGKLVQDTYFLKRLYNLLSIKPWITEHKFIENTAIPIITLVSSREYLSFKIDISIQEEKHYGLKCVKLVQNYIQKYDVLEPLIISLKTILKNSNLNNPYSGGLSSYGLILMVVSFLQYQHDSNLFKYDEYRLGRAFVSFLQYYGISFDSKKYAILASPIDDNASFFDQDNRLNFANSNELTIVDPLNKQNNVAKSTYQYSSIKMAFLIAFMVTKEDCECGCHYGAAVNENDHYTTEHCILKRIFTSVKRFSNTNNII